MQRERKIHNKYRNTLQYKNHLLKKGKFGLKVKYNFKITEKQLYSIKFLLIKKLKSLVSNKMKFKIWSLVLLNSNLTKLSSESRMGKGKGKVSTKFTFIKAGTLLFEIENITANEYKKLLEYIKKKVNTKLIFTLY